MKEYILENNNLNTKNFMGWRDLKVVSKPVIA